MTFGIGSVLATMFRIWFRHLHRILAVTLVVYLPNIAWVVVAQTEWGREFLFRHYYQPLYELHPVFYGNLASGEWLITSLLGVALAHGTLAVMTGERMAIGGAVATGVRRALPALAIGLLVRLATTGVASLVAVLIWDRRTLYTNELVVYAWAALLIFLQSLFVPALPVCAAERRGVFGAIRRSFSLARGQRLRIFAITLVQTVTMWIVFRVLFALLSPSPSGGFDSYEAWMRIWSYIGLGFELLITSLFAVMAAVVYERLRESKEGMRPADLDRVFD